MSMRIIHKNAMRHNRRLRMFRLETKKCRPSKKSQRDMLQTDNVKTDFKQIPNKLNLNAPCYPLHFYDHPIHLYTTSRNDVNSTPCQWLDTHISANYWSFSKPISGRIKLDVMSCFIKNEDVEEWARSLQVEVPSCRSRHAWIPQATGARSSCSDCVLTPRRQEM